MKYSPLLDRIPDYPFRRVGNLSREAQEKDGVRVINARIGIPDLEAPRAAAEAASVDAEVADRTRRESALLTMADRLGGSLGHRVGVHVAGAGRTGRPRAGSRGGGPPLLRGVGLIVLAVGVFALASSLLAHRTTKPVSQAPAGSAAATRSTPSGKAWRIAAKWDSWLPRGQRQ